MQAVPVQVTLVVASSRDNACPKLVTNAFEAAYSAWYATGALAADDDT